MVYSLYVLFLQSHTVVVEVNLRDAGPACFLESSREGFSSNAAQRNEPKLNFCLSFTIIPLLIATLNSDTFERSYSDCYWQE